MNRNKRKRSEMGREGQKGLRMRKGKGLMVGNGGGLMEGLAGGLMVGNEGRVVGEIGKG